MGTWIKETDEAIYLMQGGYWISRLTKYPSKTNPKEKVLNITAIQSWFTRSDPPTAMTVSLDGPEPPQMPPPPPAPPTPAVPTTAATAPSTGQTNAAGVELIKHFEGLETTAYKDSVGVLTIGYGHTSQAGPPTVAAGMKISEAEAEAILKRDLGLFERGVRDLVKVPLNSNQFSALVAFSFNLGLGSLGKSTLLKKLNAGDYNGASEQFLVWVKAGGQVLQGLVRRRNAERALFRGEDYKRFFK